LVFINDVHSLACNTAGLQLADSWYWNQDDASRKFSSASTSTSACLRTCRLPTSRPPPTTQGGRGGTLDGDKVMTTLKRHEDRRLLQQGSDPTDGRRIHDMYLYGENVVSIDSQSKRHPAPCAANIGRAESG
jgi:branched-chain amino acid transport system substrate-binding protein